MAGEITQDMIATVRHRLGDPGGKRYSDAELLSYLNEAQREVADAICDSALWALTRVQSITLIAGTSSYALAPDFLRQTRVVYKSDSYTAKQWPISEWRALRDNVHHDASETNPYYVIWDDVVIEFVVDEVTQAGSERAYVWYVKTPTEMSLTVDMDFPRHFRNIIEQHAYATALGAAPEADLDARDMEMQIFKFLCNLVNAHWGHVAPYGGLANDPEIKEPGG